jgi:hypothetical protein
MSLLHRKEKKDKEYEEKDVIINGLNDMVKKHEEKINALMNATKVITELTNQITKLTKDVYELKTEISRIKNTEKPKNNNVGITFSLEEIIIAVQKQFTQGHQAQDIIFSIGNSAERNGNITISGDCKTGDGITEKDITEGMRIVNIDGIKIFELIDNIIKARKLTPFEKEVLLYGIASNKTYNNPDNTIKVWFSTIESNCGIITMQQIKDAIKTLAQRGIITIERCSESGRYDDDLIKVTDIGTPLVKTLREERNSGKA